MPRAAKKPPPKRAKPRRPTPPFKTVADLLARLGNVPAWRVRLDPPPGTATEADLLRLMQRTGRLYELVDGVLVEKTMGYREGSLGGWLIRLIGPYLDKNDLGDLADTVVKLDWDFFETHG